jgi:BASS family bile acid:Na+ symporter
MAGSVLTQVLAPLVLVLMMLGMGLSLVPDDFRRVLVEPKAVVVGTVAQMVFLPAAAFLLAHVFPLTPPLAVGLMIIAASPGGVGSNVVAHLSRGDTALSVTLTAISSILCVATIPLIVNHSLAYFSGATSAVSLPVAATSLKVFVVTLPPILIGMGIRRRFPELALRADRPVRVFSVASLVLIIAATILKERAHLGELMRKAGPVTCSLCLLAMLVGYGAAVLARLPEAQRKTISIEVGLQNVMLAIFIAQTLLHDSEAAIPAAMYSPVCLLASAGFIVAGRGRRTRGSEPVTAAESA